MTSASSHQDKTSLSLQEIASRSHKIRARYKHLEEHHHTTPWSISEDALAFLTDAALVGRMAMSVDDRWPSNEESELGYKISECIWWLAVLAERTGIDLEQATQQFLQDKEKLLANIPTSQS